MPEAVHNEECTMVGLGPRRFPHLCLPIWVSSKWSICRPTLVSMHPIIALEDRHSEGNMLLIMWRRWIRVCSNTHSTVYARA